MTLCGQEWWSYNTKDPNSVFRPHSINWFTMIVVTNIDSFSLHGIKWLVILMQAELSTEWREIKSQLIWLPTCWKWIYVGFMFGFPLSLSFQRCCLSHFIYQSSIAHTPNWQHRQTKHTHTHTSEEHMLYIHDHENILSYTHYYTFHK